MSGRPCFLRGPVPGHPRVIPPAPILLRSLVLPQGFPSWPQLMDGWGAALLGAAHTVAGLLARGLGLEQGALQVGWCLVD